MTKFDCTIMNPPWGQLGWKIAYEAWKRTDGKVVCLNSNNILHTLSRFEEKSYFQKYKEMFGCLKSECEIGGWEEYKKFFDVYSTSNVSLTVFGKDTVNDIKRKNWYEALILRQINSNPVNFEYNVLSKFAVYLSGIRKTIDDNRYLAKHMIICQYKNGVMTSVYDKILNQDLRKDIQKKVLAGETVNVPWYEALGNCGYKKTTPYLTSGIPFKTFEEAKNFVDSQDTKFMRFVNSKLLTDIHVSQKNIFFMNDYTQPWTDARFKKHFKLTDEEWNAIANAMENIKRSK